MAAAAQSDKSLGNNAHHFRDWVIGLAKRTSSHFGGVTRVKSFELMRFWRLGMRHEPLRTNPLQRGGFTIIFTTVVVIIGGLADRIPLVYLPKIAILETRLKRAWRMSVCVFCQCHA